MRHGIPVPLNTICLFCKPHRASEATVAVGVQRVCAPVSEPVLRVQVCVYHLHAQVRMLDCRQRKRLGVARC